VNWDQLKSVLWLRWRLTRNQWRRGGGIGAILAAILVVGVCVMALGSFVGAFAGAFAMRAVRPQVVNTVWFVLTGGFLLFWLLSLIQDLQRSESIDLQRLMHLPVALGQIFVVNYVASHLSVTIVIMVPAMMGMALGLAIARSPVMLLLIPLALSMVFMITAWTYCLRGWLATLMSNPRRRRAIIMGITATVIVIAQAPNLYFNVIQRSERPPAGASVEERARLRDARSAARQKQFDKLKSAQVVAPPLWVPAGAQALAEGRVLPALFGAFGCFAIGAFGLQRAYRGTLRFYQGESGGKAAARAASPKPAPAGPPAKVGSLFLERQLPWVPEQAAALALATCRSMLRAPEVKMQFASSFVVTLLVGGSLLFRAASRMPEGAKPFVATAVVVFSLFLLVQFLGNQFGPDRDGFRALILSPAERQFILLGKNLACLSLGAMSAMALLVIVSVFLHLPPIVFLATIFQLVAGLLLAALGGNLLSILLPYRIQAGSMKPTKMPGLAMLMMVFCQLMFPLGTSPVFLAPLIGFLWQRAGGPPAMFVNLLGSMVLAGVAAFAYWKTLGPLGRLLHRRETRILGVVTVDVD
jgi:hypothetical protein